MRCGDCGRFTPFDSGFLLAGGVVWLRFACKAHGPVLMLRPTESGELPKRQRQGRLFGKGAAPRSEEKETLLSKEPTK